MHQNGIGTDATIATHIQTIQTRGYAEKDKGSLFVPTTLGVALVGGYNAIGMELAKPEMRAQVRRDAIRGETWLCRSVESAAALPQYRTSCGSAAVENELLR